VLRLIERLHDIEPMAERDRRADDMLDSFDFEQQPLDPLVLEERDCATE
jgi:hypothetical protein